MTNGGASPRNSVFLSNSATSGATTMPSRYMQKVISDYPVDPNDPSADPGCTATADHVAACDVNNERQNALDAANQHIADLSAVTPVSHVCM